MYIKSSWQNFHSKVYSRSRKANLANKSLRIIKHIFKINNHDSKEQLGSAGAKKGR